MKRIRLFSDFQSVSRTERLLLEQCQLIDEKDVPVSWVRLSKLLMHRKLSVREAKQLVLLEIERGSQDARLDIIQRLIVYIAKDERGELNNKITKLLK